MNKHKIGKHGTVCIVGKDSDTCVECGKKVKPRKGWMYISDNKLMKMCFFDSRTTKERQSEPKWTTTTSKDKPMKKETKKGESWRRGFQAGVEETIKEFTSGKRCLKCGIIKNEEDITKLELSDFCQKCWEEA